MDLRRLFHNAPSVCLALVTAAQAALGAPAPPAPAPPREEARLRRAFPKGLAYWSDGRPRRILLPGEELAADKSLPALREASLRIVSENGEVFGVDAEDLVIETERVARNVVYQIFGQTHEGIPVEGGRVDFRWTPRGGLTMVGMDVADIGDLDLHPALSADEAFAASVSAVGLEDGRAVRERVELVVVPDGHLAQKGDRLAYKIILRAPPGETGWWLVWIDAHRGDVLEARDLILHASPQGEVQISYEPFTAGDPEVIRPAPHATIALHRATGEPVGSPVFTDAQGRFSFPESGSDLVYVTYLEGRYCKVINEATGNTTPVIEVPVSGGPSDMILWDDGNSAVVERDAYAHVNIAHDVTKAWDPDFTFWDRPMPTVVDAGGACNAYFDGQRIVFYWRSGGCEATGRIADVVYHEYAHGITWALYLPQSAPAEMHEAYSDYYGTTITDQPYIGVGFFGPGTTLRSVDNDRRWPWDRHSDPHITGLILAGALWDLREAVGAEVADPLYHFHRYGRPMSFNEAFFEILLVDDDDGNVFNGTPHFNEITEAFLDHGIGSPSVQIQHEPLPDTELTQTDLGLSANVLSLFGLEPDSLLVYYRGEPESPFSELRMEPDPGGGTRAFRATIPGQSEGTRIEYYLFAADTTGHRGSLPAGAPGDVFTFLVGRDEVPPVVSFEPIPHGTSDQSAYPVEARVTDNTGIVATVELLTRRPGDDEVSLPLNPVSGDLYTGVLDAGEVRVGDVIEYRIAATDASAGANRATWPVDGSWAVFEIREGWFESLEQTGGGLEPHGDWTWGELADSKGEAHSGDKVWATKLEGPYTGLAHSHLDLELDLTGWDRGTLEFWHRYATEPGQDGGRILVSRDGGPSFRPIAPRRGYPWRQVAALEGEGYSGRINDWERVEVPLDIYLGGRIAIRFEFASDREFGDDGWIVDDIRLIRRQALAEPIGLTAESGQPTRIPLSWQSPRSVIPDSNHERFAGYNVYRGTASGVYDGVPINPSPVRNESYVDAAVEPGATYYYTVTAVYDEGESPFAHEASGSSVEALLSISVDSMNVHLEKDASIDTTFAITNAGSGDLAYETYIGDPGQRLSDVRLVYELGRGSVARPRTLHLDPEDGTSPDIASVSAGDDGERLVLLLREHSPHGDPHGDFTVTFGLDTDLDQDTGFRTTNHGADYIVLVGARAMELENEPAVLVDGTDWTRVGLPVELSVAPGADSVRVEIPLSLIGTPERMAIRGVALDEEGVVVDSQPDDPGASWLSRTPTGGSVSPASPALVTLSLTADGLTDDEYRGRVLLETSDIGRPEAGVDVVLIVGAGPGILASLEFKDLEEGVEIRWSVAADFGIRAFRLYRSLEGEDEIRLGGGSDILPEEDGDYRYIDRLAMTGATYTYRFEGVADDGSTRAFGLESTVYDPPAPLELFMQRPRPSPFRSTVLVRFGIPRSGSVDLDIYDVQGRRVATLLRGQAEAGIHDVIWDGRDGSGRRAASGVYFALLRWERIRSVRRLVLAR